MRQTFLKGKYPELMNPEMSLPCSPTLDLHLGPDFISPHVLPRLPRDTCHILLFSDKMGMRNAVFRDVTPRDSRETRRFGRTYRLHHHDEKNLRPKSNASSN
jgi:hypothetical protein